MEKSEGVKKIKSLAHCDQHLFLIWDSSINCILKLAVTLLKLAVCILCMLYVMENAEKINFLRIAKIISVFYGITLPFALFFNQSPLFWITNDYVNKYTTTRLRLFYYETSELGFRLIIVMVV